jgi:hypothetical protein
LPVSHETIYRHVYADKTVVPRSLASDPLPNVPSRLKPAVRSFTGREMRSSVQVISKQSLLWLNAKVGLPFWHTSVAKRPTWSVKQSLMVCCVSTFLKNAPYRP